MYGDEGDYDDTSVCITSSVSSKYGNIIYYTMLIHIALKICP